jgi:hypothetical protein
MFLNHFNIKFSIKVFSLVSLNLNKTETEASTNNSVSILKQKRDVGVFKNFEVKALSSLNLRREPPKERAIDSFIEEVCLISPKSSEAVLDEHKDDEIKMNVDHQKSETQIDQKKPASVAKILNVEPNERKPAFISKTVKVDPSTSNQGTNVKIKEMLNTVDNESTSQSEKMRDQLRSKITDSNSQKITQPLKMSASSKRKSSSSEIKQVVKLNASKGSLSSLLENSEENFERDNNGLDFVLKSSDGQGLLSENAEMQGSFIKQSSSSSKNSITHQLQEFEAEKLVIQVRNSRFLYKKNFI